MIGDATYELTFADIIVARSMSPSVVNEVALRLAMERMGNGSMAIITDHRDELKSIRLGSHGIERVVRLIAVVGTERRLCLAVGHPRHERVREWSMRLGQPALSCDATTECVLLRTNGGVEKIGPFEPAAVAISLGRVLGGETAFDAVVEGWGQALTEQHLRPEDVSDHQRDALLAKLDRLGRRNDDSTGRGS